MARAKFVVAIALLAAHALSASAPAVEPMDPAALDARVHALSQQLRCVVCQNQTLADSNAELALDLRRQIRQHISEGADEEAVKNYLVQRYGDFVLYDPPLKPVTWVLWFGPLALLLLVVALLGLARRSRGDAAGPLKDEERRRLDAMLQEPQRGQSP